MPVAVSYELDPCDAMKAKELFGDAFVTDYAATRTWEQAQADLQVTQWQRERYFEII